MQAAVALFDRARQPARLQHAVGVLQHARDADLANEARLQVVLTRQRVEQLDAGAKLGVVDRQGDTSVGVEQARDE